MIENEVITTGDGKTKTNKHTILHIVSGGAIFVLGSVLFQTIRQSKKVYKQLLHTVAFLKCDNECLMQELASERAYNKKVKHDE